MDLGLNPTDTAPSTQEVSGWINKKATIPVWAKMTPNITDITLPARAALETGSEGVAAINTIQSVMGINLDTLRPEPSVEGHSTPGGYSCKAVKPIALAKVGFGVSSAPCRPALAPPVMARFAQACSQVAFLLAISGKFPTLLLWPNKRDVPQATHPFPLCEVFSRI